MAHRLNIGSKVRCRLFNTPDRKFYGDYFDAEVLDIVDHKGEPMYLVAKPGACLIHLHRKEIIKIIA